MNLKQKKRGKSKTREKETIPHGGNHNIAPHPSTSTRQPELGKLIKVQEKASAGVEAGDRETNSI